MNVVRTTVRSHQSDLGRWLLINRKPPAALRPYILTYSGYLEQDRCFGQHLQTPFSGVPLIINLGSPYRISGPHGDELEVRSFVAGLHDGPVLVGSRGLQHCVQIDLTPLGAHRLFKLPMHELSNRTLDLDDVPGRRFWRLPERLHEAANWDTRFELLDSILAAQIQQGPEFPREVAYAWTQLARSNGRMSIGSLASDLGWSHRRLIARFREYIGLPPKTIARILRFERALNSINGSDDVCLATVAQTAGYFDQAHMHRDFRQFARLTPAQLLNRRLPGMDGLIGD